MSYFIVILVPILITVLYAIFAGAAHNIFKVLFSLFLAAALNSEIALFPDSSFLNYIAWAGIMLALFFLLHWLPRTGRCMDYTAIYFFVAMLSMLGTDILMGWLTPDDKVNTVHYLLLFLFSAICCAIVPIIIGRETDFSNKILRGFDRVLASAVMGVVFSYAGTQVFSYDAGSVLFWVLAGIIAVLWYPADMFAFEHVLNIYAQVLQDAKEEETKKEVAQHVYESSEEYQARLEKADRKEKEREERRRAREKRREERDRAYEERRRDRELEDQIRRYDEQKRQEEEMRRLYEGW